MNGRMRIRFLLSLFAFGTGPGSERIRGFLHNTELFTIMRVAMD